MEHFIDVAIPNTSGASSNTSCDVLNQSAVVAVVAVVAAQMIRCLCGWSGRGWMVARTMHGAVLHAFYLEASGLSVMHSSVARRDPQWQGGEWARGGARGTPAVD